MGGSSKTKLTERILVRALADITLVVSLLFAPWQATLVLGILGAFIFPRFFEIIIVGILFDLLYAPTGVGVMVLLGTISGMALYGSIEYAKTHLRGY